MRRYCCEVLENETAPPRRPPSRRQGGSIHRSGVETPAGVSPVGEIFIERPPGAQSFAEGRAFPGSELVEGDRRLVNGCRHGSPMNRAVSVAGVGRVSAVSVTNCCGFSSRPLEVGMGGDVQTGDGVVIRRRSGQIMQIITDAPAVDQVARDMDVPTHQHDSWNVLRADEIKQSIPFIPIGELVVVLGVFLVLPDFSDGEDFERGFGGFERLLDPDPLLRAVAGFFVESTGDTMVCDHQRGSSRKVWMTPRSTL